MATPDHPSNRRVLQQGHPRAELVFRADRLRLGPAGNNPLNHAPDELYYLFSRFPALGRMFASGAPLLIGTRAERPPVASPQRFETGGCPDAVSRALDVCRALNQGAILTGLPLTLLHLLLEHRRRGGLLPSRLLLLIEGCCPASLERAFLQIVAEPGTRVELAHVYGISSLGTQLLAAVERTSQGQPVYRSVHPRWRAGIYRGQLGFAWRGAGTRLPYLAEEDACPYGDGFLLFPLRKRFAPAILATLEQWSTEDWRRRTGFLISDGRRLIYQLRPDTVPESPDEISYHEFSAAYPFNSPDRPGWSAAPSERVPRSRLKSKA